MPPELALIQAPHCLADFRRPPHLEDMGPGEAATLVSRLADQLGMKRKGDPQIVQAADGRLSVYQIVATSHIIIHIGRDWIHADLFSCEPFDVDSCVDSLRDRFGDEAAIQYCQRNLTTTPGTAPAIPMRRMNALTSNPQTFTHALINWYDGDEMSLASADRGVEIVRQALDCLAEGNKMSEGRAFSEAEIRILSVAPIPDSWDQGGISGGYVNLMRQLTVHTFRGINAAYTDVMAHCFDLERILKIIQDGFGFTFYEVDAIFQRSAP